MGLVLAAQRIGGGGGAEAEFAELRVRGFHAPVAVEAVAGVDVEGGVGGVAAGRRGDALVGERAVDIAAREAEAAAPEVEAGIEAGLRHSALRGGKAARERESDDGDGLFVHGGLLSFWSPQGGARA